MRIVIFKISVLLIGLSILMIYTHDLIILTKIKERICYYESLRYGGKTLSTHVSIVLMRVSVPAEDIKHALKGSSTFVPTQPLAHQHLRTQSCPSWTNTFVSTQVLQATHKQTKSS
jgi:hypothetical protein